MKEMKHIQKQKVVCEELDQEGEDTRKKTLKKR